MKTYIKEILTNRKDLDRKLHTAFSKKICETIENIKEYKTAINLLAFYPYSGEVNILPLVKKALDEGKNVYFPKVTGATTMEFIQINSLKDFVEGYKGIREPKGENIFHKNNISYKTFMILPGSAFDVLGNRCGYGKGYYDRYLEDCFLHITKAGVCFSLQMLSELPDVKKTDIPVDYVINEKMIIRSENRWKC